MSSQSGKFEAIRTTSMMVHSSYFLPDDGKTWIAAGYGTIYSSNAGQMTCTLVQRSVAGPCERRTVSLPAIPRIMGNCGTISRQKFGWDWRQSGSVPPMRTGPILRTAGSNCLSSIASSWLRMDPLFHCE